MSNIPNLSTPFPYADTIQIGNDVSPGKATVIHGESSSDWDERKGDGITGATLWPKGDPLSTFSILFELWDESSYAAWLSFYKNISPRLPSSWHRGASHSQL